MIKQAFASLVAHRRRFVSTVVAVVLGVAFMAGTMVLTSTMESSFDDLFSEINAGTDAYVRSPREVGGVRDRVPADLVESVREVDGVAAAFGTIEGYAQLIGADGKVVEPALGSPALAMSWVDDPDLNAFDVVAGRAPRETGEVAVDRRTFAAAEVAVGDDVTVLTETGLRPATLVGVLSFGDTDSPLGATVVTMPYEDVVASVGAPGQIDAVVVRAAGLVAPDVLADRLAAAMPGVEVLTGAELTVENRDGVAEGLNLLSTFLMAFAGVAMFVGAFIIHNTFSIVIAQRTRELALLRAIGASRPQLLRGVLAESLLVGAGASLLGVGAGIGVGVGMRALLEAAGLSFDGPVQVTGELVVPFLAGLIVCVLAALHPALQATRVAPIAAMRDDAVAEAAAAGRRRVVLGGVTLALGTAAVIAGLSGSALSLLGIGSLIVLVGLRVLLPAFAAPAARLLGGLAAVRGISGRVARDNAARNPKRTAATASALVIGVGLVGFATIVAASAKHAVDRAVNDAVVADLVVDAGTFSPGLPPAVADDIRELDGVAAVSPIRIGTALVDGGETMIAAYDPATIASVLELGVASGELADLAGDSIALQADTAADLGVAVGDQLTVGFPTGERSLDVVATYDERFVSGNHLIGIDTFAAGFPVQLDQDVLVVVEPGQEQAVEGAIEALTADFPTVGVQDREEFRRQTAGQIDQFLAIIYGLLALAVVIALIGIANTLSLSIHERTREIGLLRAVGMSRRQVRSAVRWEAAIVALLGTLLGIGAGVVLGSAGIEALGAAGIDRTVIPVGQLAVIAVLGAVAGLAAAALPARRAARMNVLDALRTN